MYLAANGQGENGLKLKNVSLIFLTFSIVSCKNRHKLSMACFSFEKFSCLDEISLSEISSPNDLRAFHVRESV